MNQTSGIMIIDYGMGNLLSVYNAVRYLGFDVFISDRAEDMDRASGLILPGVGAFGQAMANLNDSGLVTPMTRKVMEDKLPFLGICLGMQLICNSSQESPGVKGLSWIDAEIVKFDAAHDLRLPHIGWNDIHIPRKTFLLDKIEHDTNFYFVHSYYLDGGGRDVVAATCTYGNEFTAVVQKDNISAAQFHPEKSQANGLRLLNNFLQTTSTEASYA